MDDRKVSMFEPTFRSLYAFDFERNFNSRDAIQWTVENRKLSVMLAAAYVAVIFGLKRFMRHREKLSLRLPLALWSGALAAFSIAAALRFIPESLHVIKNHGWEDSVCVPTVYFGDTGIWAFLFVISKVLEFGDTLFIVLRKQPLIFLHWYHHSTVLVLSWYMYAYFQAPARWFGCINALVHSFMYSYYFLRALRVRMPRFVSVFVTSIQIAQMAFGIYVNLTAKWVLDRGDECHVTYENVIYSLLMYASYFILFGHFFLTTYTLKPKKSVNGLDHKQLNEHGKVE